MLNCAANREPIALQNPLHYWIPPFACSFSKCKAGQHGRDHDGKKKRSEQRKHDSPCHRMKESPFHALQGEDRQECRHRDENGVKDRPLNFVRGVADLLRRRPPVVCMAQMANDVLDENDCAFYHNAEIKRTDGEKVCRNTAQIEAKSNANGIVVATMIAPRALPRNRNRMIETRIIPSLKLCSTVCEV